MIYWDDLRVGEQHTLGSHTLTRDEIIDFARRFDPQPFHLDEEAAARGTFGGIIASGWHTASVCMRLLVDGFVGRAASMGSPGVDELRWWIPVRPGDTVTLRFEIVELTPSRSRPDRGAVKVRMELRNQRDEVVLTMYSPGIFGRRPADGSTDA